MTVVGVLAASVPERLGSRYRVLGSVGRGAIAEVVRARDERTGEEVALKILYPHLRESAAVVERFRREVEIVRRIAHPHVLAIREVADSDGQLFLVMDYHPGGDLADRLARQRRFEADDLRVLAAQLCGALAAAHRAGVVHRDVKPSNVLCGAGPGLDVRLCDFGLARTADLSGLTTANAVLGTPEYMAPEVVVDGHADPRSDIYSLGVMLFEAATGRLPFYGDSPYQLMRQHVDVEAPRARSLVPDLPPAIDDAIARALAKDPLDRFATVEDFARALAVDSPSTGSIALSAAPVLSPARRACARCGGWMVEAAAVCADCGKALLRLETEPGGVNVLVTGPGQVADKLDAQKQVALYKLLDELPEGSLQIQRGRRRAPRVPFYVAKGITRPSAAALVARLESIGLDACIAQDTPLARRAIRGKLWQTTYRPLAGYGIVSIESLRLLRLVPRHWGLLGLLAPLVVMAGGLVAMFAVAVVQIRRPIVRRVAGGRARSDAERRLEDVLPRLVSRQDRRLVAHIVERLAQIRTAGQAATVQPLADRAAEAADALSTLDARRDADASVDTDPARALEELRREEVTRVLLRADLLRGASWLDRLSQGLARAAAADAADAAQVEQDLAELKLAIDAEAELAVSLESAR